MRFFLKHLVPGSARGRTLRIRNSRRLSFERLDSRRLLAADVGEPVEETAYVAPAEDGADSPLWGSTSNGGTATMSSDSGYGGYGFIAPEISNFGGSQGGPDFWTFTGSVLDDKSVEGLLVNFGSLLAGQSTMVQADGSFELSFTFPEGTIGWVTATVTDWDGITSEEVMFYVG
ncbi:MAG: hypothetical protein WD894_00420 [Pirellulales bacterium]